MNGSSKHKFEQAAARFPNLSTPYVTVKDAEQKSMVEQGQPIPVLTPDGMEDVTRAHYQQRLNNERQRVERLNNRAQALYGKILTEIQSDHA